MNVLRVIRRMFGVRVQDDTMPVCSLRGDRLILADCWNQLGYKTGVEIGIERATYSLELLKRIPNCHLTLIDPWALYEYTNRTVEGQDKNFIIASEILEPFVASGRATILRATSMEVVGDFADESLDFVFIDGDHTYDNCSMDLICWSRKVRSGGMVAVHDYLPMRHCGVPRAVESYTFCHNIFPWFVTREKFPTAFWVKP